MVIILLQPHNRNKSGGSRSRQSRLPPRFAKQRENLVKAVSVNNVTPWDISVDLTSKTSNTKGQYYCMQLKICDHFNFSQKKIFIKLFMLHESSIQCLLLGHTCSCKFATLIVNFFKVNFYSIYPNTCQTAASFELNC